MNDLVLLRNIVGHIVVGHPFQMNDHANYMSRGFSPLTQEGYGLKREAGADLRCLAKRLFEASGDFKRKVAYSEFHGFLAGHVVNEFYKRKDEPVTEADLQGLKASIEKWVADTSSPRKVFVPCIINTYPTASFSVGPVTFDFIDNFTKPVETTPDFDPFPDILEHMRSENAFWMATVNLPACSDSYGYDLANLCVDLAITGLQLVIPLYYSRSACRMESKRSANTEIRTTLANGALSQRRSTANTGFFLGSGSIEQFISDSPRMLPSTGNRVKAFLTGESAVPKLETAWSDAAYWFHEGVAEPIDSIATCKLETALEALLRGTSIRTVKDTLKRAARLAFEIDENEPIFTSPHIIAKDFIADVTEMRSRILHGTLSTLGTETSEIRSQLEKFVGIMLQIYTLGLDKYIELGQPKDDLTNFFQWSETHRASNPQSRFSIGWTGKAA